MLNKPVESMRKEDFMEVERDRTTRERGLKL
jgi:hypothetical protein